MVRSYNAQQTHILLKNSSFISPPHAFLLPLSSHLLLLQAVQHRLLLQGGKGIAAYQRFRGRFFIFLPLVYSEAWPAMTDSPAKPENNRRTIASETEQSADRETQSDQKPAVTWVGTSLSPIPPARRTELAPPLAIDL
jgi:hypothetical protein